MPVVVSISGFMTTTSPNESKTSERILVFDWMKIVFDGSIIREPESELFC